MTAALVGAGVAIVLVCSAGFLLARDVYARLHYVSAAPTAGTLLVAAAVVVEEGMSARAILSLLVLAVALAGGPAVAHATGRMARMRDER